jgi:RES domain-containing protein
MILYRIAKCVYADDLSGTGARLYGGRWNSVGKPMVYLASTRALAMLEVLVHLSPTLLPADFCFAEIEVPDNNIAVADSETLPADWKNPLGPIALQRLGDAFLKNQEYLLMKVPSAIVDEEYNYLLNPLHPQASAVKILRKQAFNFDERLF